MDWSVEMGRFIKMILGIPENNRKKRKFAIKPKMVSPYVVQMDMDSFQKSDAVKRQAKAAREL